MQLGFPLLEVGVQPLTALDVVQPLAESIIAGRLPIGRDAVAVSVIEVIEERLGTLPDRWTCRGQACPGAQVLDLAARHAACAGA